MLATAIASALLLAPARFEPAARYFEETGGHAMVVMQDGKVVFERYTGRWSADTPHYLASGSKSFIGLMAVAAQEDGLLSLDEPVAKSITEWKDDRTKPTLRQLLTLTSGLGAGRVRQAQSWADSLQVNVVSAPGERFQYGPAPFQIFGEVMRRKLANRNQTPLEYLQKRVLDRIGMKLGRWNVVRGTSDAQLAGGATAAPREWVKLGQLMLEGGKGVLKPESHRLLVTGTTANPGYGLTWWLNKPGTRPAGRFDDTFGDGGKFWPNGPETTYMAAGAGKQRLYVIPSERMVVVRMGQPSNFSDAKFLDLVVTKR